MNTESVIEKMRLEGGKGLSQGHITAFSDIQRFSTLNLITLYATEVSSDVFLSVLDLDASDLPEILQESFTDSLRNFSPQEPLCETSVEKLIQSIQEVFSGKLKV